MLDGRKATGTEVDAPSAPRCVYCGYDLSHAAGGTVCPECGRAYKARRVGATRVPWAQRRYRGRARAYVQTLWELVVRPRTFRAEARIGGPEARRAGRAFRNVTVAAAGIGVGAFLGWQCAAATIETTTTAAAGGWRMPTAVAVVAVATACLTAAVAWVASECLPGVACADADDRRRPYAREALLYACGPMALVVPLIAAASVAATVLETRRGAIVNGTVIWPIAAWGMAGLAGAGSITSWRMVRVILGRGVGRAVGAVLTATALWALAAAFWWMGMVVIGGAGEMILGDR